MEEKDRELRNLVPLLQQATTLIECTGMVRNVLSANFSHVQELFHSLRGCFGHQETRDQQSSHSELRQQLSTDTQASSRLSSAMSDCDGEEKPPRLNEQALASKELRQLTAHIITTFSAVDSHLHSRPSVRVPDHHQMSGIDLRPTINTGTQLGRSVSQSDDPYDHLSDIGEHKGSEERDRSTETDCKENAHDKSMQGCSSPHTCKRFNIDLK